MQKNKNKICFALIILISLMLAFGIVNTKEVNASTYTFTEDFTTDTYKDASYTEVTWDTLGGKAEMTSTGEMRLTSNTSTQTDPYIYGDYIVYEDSRNGNYDIYMYQISTGDEARITTDSNSQTDPVIYGDYIAWKDTRNGNDDIYMYQISTETETRVTTDSSYQKCPDIWGDYIVWHDGRNAGDDIYAYKISTATELAISTRPAPQIEPAIYNDYVVWQDFTDIYRYQISTTTETQITSDGSYQMGANVYGDYITWTDTRNGNNDIYMYKMSASTESQVTLDANNQTSSSSYDNYIVWRDNRNGNNDIYMYDIVAASELRVTTSTNDQSNPVIYGEYLVWNDDRDGNLNIYGELNQVQSTGFTTTSGNILSATLTATDTTPAGTNIDYFLSNDDGTTWESVTSGSEHTFSSTGTQPKWKAILTHTGDITATPYISEVSIVFNIQDGRRYTPADLDTTPPATVNNISIEKFPYSVSRDLLITWQNPEEEDFNGVNVYRTKGKCPTDINQLNLNQDNLLIETTPSMQAMFDFSIEDIFSTYCYLFESKDANGNLSDVGTYEITPFEIKSFTDSERVSEIINELVDSSEKETGLSADDASKIKYDLVEVYKDYKSTEHSLNLMNYLRGRIILLVEEGAPANLYYVSPKEQYPHRYSLSWETVYDVFGKLSWGINQTNLDKIPVCGKGIGNPFDLPRTLLLNVEDGGSIWYFDGECRYSITRENMWTVIPQLALGINLDNLSKVPLGELKK